MIQTLQVFAPNNRSIKHIPEKALKIKIPPTIAWAIANGLYWNTNGAGNRKMATINLTTLSAGFWFVSKNFIL